MRTPVAIFLAICFSATALAGTVNVPADEPTIQAGIDAAATGDEVVVAPGTYFETIDFHGRAITVRSADPSHPATVANTVIDAAGGGSVVKCVSGEGPDTVLDGFTITGGTGTFIRVLCIPIHCFDIFGGGGMYNSASSPTVRRCTFSGNFVANDGMGLGAGMANIDSNPTVTDCTFSDNYSPAGGGMLNENSSPVVIGCVFVGNGARVGGGMQNGADSNPIVINSRFIENSALDAGGAMRNYEATATLVNCVFSGNEAATGGGMTNQNGGNPILTNCSFTGNVATVAGGAMESVALGPQGTASFPVLRHCIIWGNLPDEIVDAGGSEATLILSNVQGGWAGAGSRNIDADPLFVDADNNDVRLSPGSPCIDAGHNWAVAPDATDVDGDGDTRELTPYDLDGNPRFTNDPATTDTGCGVSIPFPVDMGAYEFQGTPAPDAIYLADLNGDLNVDTMDFLTLIGSWGPADLCDVADLDLDGHVGTTDFLTLLGNWSS